MSEPHICIRIAYYSKYLFCVQNMDAFFFWYVSSPLWQYKYINKNVLFMYLWNMKPDDDCFTQPETCSFLHYHNTVRGCAVA